MADGKIEVFQDLYLYKRESNREVLRTALIKAATTPWRHHAEQEKKIIECTGTNDDVIVFKRDESDGIDAVELSLWSDNSGFKVSNIVPCELGSLGEYKYNLALQDFVNQVVTPAKKITEFDVINSQSRQGLDDWLTPDAAKALRQFSGTPNKSTGSSHPADRRRWLTFIFAVHRANLSLNAELLQRWFIEVASWPQDIAQELAIEYEFALEILQQYEAESP
ncbi:MAG: hypothetical protein OXO49_08225 [Gammaproteobacteria bacterium]|nr:hypothetical protein [Gammaproteobacteria bacterium]MDE0251541.1 hypothetical protein [Gammaproteobacteria bacterium]MDE0403449.1 hypothetical protein [Gammaproteobacteria bacterium]